MATLKQALEYANDMKTLYDGREAIDVLRVDVLDGTAYTAYKTLLDASKHPSSSGVNRVRYMHHVELMELVISDL